MATKTGTKTMEASRLPAFLAYIIQQMMGASTTNLIIPPTADTSASVPCKTYSSTHLAEAGEHLARHSAQVVTLPQKNTEMTQRFSLQQLYS